MFYKYQIIAGIALVTTIGLVRIIVAIRDIKKTCFFWMNTGTTILN